MARIKQQSHRVTETRRLSQVKTLKGKDSSPTQGREQISMQGICLSAHRKGTGALGIGALAIGTSILATEAKASEKATDVMVVEQKSDVEMKADIPMSPEVSVALAIAAMASAASTVFFGIKAYKSKRKIPGIVGPSGLVPSESKGYDGKTNPFSELVGDDEFARIKKEMRIWGIKNRKERYYLHMHAESMNVRLIPRDFKYTMNKSGVALAVSLTAAMAFAALHLAGKEYPVKDAEPAKVEQKDASAQ